MLQEVFLASCLVALVAADQPSSYLSYRETEGVSAASYGPPLQQPHKLPLSVTVTHQLPSAKEEDSKSKGMWSKLKEKKKKTLALIGAKLGIKALFAKKIFKKIKGKVSKSKKHESPSAKPVKISIKPAHLPSLPHPAPPSPTYGRPPVAPQRTYGPPPVAPQRYINAGSSEFFPGGLPAMHSDIFPPSPALIMPPGAGITH